ncbi:MAG: TRAP transporter TatT component family protein [Nevskiales bacterium]
MRICGSLLATMAFFVALGCANNITPVPAVPNSPVAIGDAMQAYEQADSRDSLLRAIRMLERYAQDHPGDYASRARLANAYSLLGMGYTQDIGGKEAAYSAAVRYAEAAMLTVPGFAHVWKERGVTFALALQQLDHRHVEAMEYYKVAQFSDYEECKGAMGRVLGISQMQRAVAVMDRLAQIDENVSWGNNRMMQGLYKLRQPDYLGGDHVTAMYMLERAIQDNLQNVAPRWGRAKYFAVPAGKRQLFVSDLRWVVEQPLDQLVGYKPWNIVIQRDARALLSQTNRLF